MAGGKEDDPSDPAYWNKFLGEGHTPFEPEPDHTPDIDTLRSLYAAVLSNYNYTCAITGRAYPPPAELLHDKLEVTPIQPLHLGGALHVSNFLCLEPEASQAFRAGHLAVGPQRQILADLSLVDPELLERTNPIGRLHLPELDVARPDPQALAFHRRHFFAAS